MECSPLARYELEEQLVAWGKGIISTEGFYEWVESNYLPLHGKLAQPGESELTKRAMHTILNAFDNLRPSDLDPTEQ